MPAAVEPSEAKTERDELLWQALKEHIMLERQKKKEGEYAADPYSELYTPQHTYIFIYTPDS